MEGSCSGTSQRSSAEDDFTDLLLPQFLKENLDENLYKQQEEENCELCPQNTHSESAELIWDLPGTGNMSTLSDSDREAIVSDAKDGQCFFNADEDPEIEKATTDVKKECDLLTGENTLFKNLRWQDVEGRCVDLPFELTEKEREIIHYTRSSFILGRSGTRKTTILTRKLNQTFQKYCIGLQDSRAADDDVSITDEVDVKLQHGGSALHQIFVTVSPQLCHAAKKSLAQLQSIANENVSGYNNFNGVDDVDEVSEFKDIPDTFVGIRQEQYPLVITFQKFLMMLDGTLGKSYFQRYPYVRDSSHSEGRRSVALQTFLRKNEVTYDRFSSIYWPHFNTKLTKGLDASRVFTEIMSHIKGGPLEGEAYHFKRSKQEYISLSESRISTLCVEQRCAIYDIFKDYEKIKLKRGEFDLANFVSDIHLRLQNEDLRGDKMNFVYIDEVQDLTMRQISLFRYICNNIDEGFVFSGDTA